MVNTPAPDLFHGFESSGGVLKRGLDQLILECYSALYRYARVLCRDPVVAEDLVQEALLRAMRASRPPRELSLVHVRPWLFRILRNVWLNECRRRRRDAPEESLAADPALPMEPGPSGEADRYRVLAAIESLPPLYREVILLRDLEGLSYQEIAHLLECPLGTVMSRLARARSKLRRALLGTLAPQGKKAS